MHERLIAPYVPEEAKQRPAGAAVDGAGMVSCVACQQRIPLTKADVVGLGYRCVPCTHKAELAKLTGGGDAASHFTANERRGLTTSGTQLVIGGIGVLILGGLLLPFAIKPGIIVLVAGATMLSIGLGRRSAAH